MSIVFSASVMCADFTDLKNQLKKLEEIGIHRLHYDIMDGIFVPNITLGIDMIRDITKVCSLPIDVHLMVTEPSNFLEMLIKYKIDSISFHVESNPNEAFRMVDWLHEHNIKAGIAISPITPVSQIELILGRIDIITVMTVDPGFAGQHFIPVVLKKIDALRKIREENNFKYTIMVDGSVNLKTIPEIMIHSPDILILGNSGLFGDSEGLEAAYKKILTLPEVKTSL